jgi:hypothetical protein
LSPDIIQNIFGRDTMKSLESNLEKILQPLAGNSEQHAAPAATPAALEEATVTQVVVLEDTLAGNESAAEAASRTLGRLP